MFFKTYHTLLLIFLLITPTFAYNSKTFQTSIEEAALHHPGPEPANKLTILHGHTVRMVEFSDYTQYKPASSTKLVLTTWVTTQSDMYKRCHEQLRKIQQSQSHENLNAWIAQLVGLPTDNAEKRRFVVMDVPVIQAYYGPTPSAVGIFRPCTDPRIDTPVCPKLMNPHDSYIASDYKTWFINNSIASYSAMNGAPWTEYGYTYNWNPHAKNVYGLSEFVILKNTAVAILPNPNDKKTAYVSAEEFCK